MALDVLGLGWSPINRVRSHWNFRSIYPSPPPDYPSHVKTKWLLSTQTGAANAAPARSNLSNLKSHTPAVDLQESR